MLASPKSAKMDLPYDEWTHVMSFLDIRDLSRVRLVNRCLGSAAQRLYLDPKTDNRALVICTEQGYDQALAKVLQQPKVIPDGPYPNYTIYLPNLECIVNRDFLTSIYDWFIGPSHPGYPLRVAVLRGHYLVVDLLLKDGRFDPNSYHGFCLLRACQRGDIPMIQRLLADPRTIVTSHSLMSSIMSGRLDVVQLLIDHGVDLTRLNLTHPKRVDQSILNLLRDRGWNQVE